MYAVNCREEFAEMIPSIIHIDGTCRVQTVTKEQNEHFYNLIQEFYLQTGVPLLFNTSFNLAGEPLVETPEDAINTFTNSEIDCLYFPENKKLICKL
jgi:carbamoyltransferase